jgi:hypothetical protein
MYACVCVCVCVCVSLLLRLCAQMWGRGQGTGKRGVNGGDPVDLHAAELGEGARALAIHTQPLDQGVPHIGGRGHVGSRTLHPRIQRQHPARALPPRTQYQPQRQSKHTYVGGEPL